MKKIPKAALNSINQKQKRPLQQLAKYFLRGILAGIIFQGSFMLFKFENRVVRGVTSNRLDHIREMDIEAGGRIQKGQSPDIPLEYLRDSFREKCQKDPKDKNNKN